MVSSGRRRSEGTQQLSFAVPVQVCKSAMNVFVIEVATMLTFELLADVLAADGRSKSGETEK
jgi:hypothetical protein